MIATAGADGLDSPDWLLAGFDIQHDRYHLARVNRETYHASAFLDHRINPLPTETISLSAAQVDIALGSKTTRPAGWIFHTGFCGSTLLANCLDHPGTTLVLREPLVLARLARNLRDTSDRGSPDMQGLMERVTGLCERSYPGETCIIKTSNFSNVLIPHLMLPVESGRPQRKAVLMSCSLEALLLSILKKKSEAEILLQGFLRALLQDSDYLTQVNVPAPDSLDLLQQGVLFWHCQRYFLQTRMAQSGTGTFMSLSMERFLAEPKIVLSEVSGFLQLGLAEELLGRTIADGAFRRHSKISAASYDAMQQQREQQTTAARYRSEMAAALEWAKPLLDALPVEAFDAFEQQAFR